MIDVSHIEKRFGDTSLAFQPDEKAGWDAIQPLRRAAYLVPERERTKTFIASLNAGNSYDI